MNWETRQVRWLQVRDTANNRVFLNTEQIVYFSETDGMKGLEVRLRGNHSVWVECTYDEFAKMVFGEDGKK